MTWPLGFGKEMKFHGRCRDILTPAEGGRPLLLQEDELHAGFAQDRTILSLDVVPHRPGIEVLVGRRGGDYLRAVIDEHLPAERKSASPLYLLLDDLSGASLIAGWAWSQWLPDWLPKNFVPDDDDEARALRLASMASICIGFRPGSSALEDLRSSNQNCCPVEPLQHPEDPEGWHHLEEHLDTSMRRARRIDVWIESGTVRIDSGFQDSASVPGGGRVAIHEYSLELTADLDKMELASIRATPRILPYPECPAAVNNLQRLIGTPLCDLPTVVLKELRRVQGCTHLNDALRALSSVPMLLAHL